MKKNKFGLMTIQKSISTKSKKLLKDIQSEIVDEEKESLKDFIKGAYRLSVEKQREVKRLEEEIANLNTAIEKASGGKWDELSKIKIPARFFEESTLRKHGKSLISGNDEIRFVDLYLDEE